MNRTSMKSGRRATRWLVGLATASMVLLLPVAIAPASAQRPPVDLATSWSARYYQTVPDAPFVISPGVSNSGSETATNVRAEITFPPGVQLLPGSSCATAPTGATCNAPDLGPNQSYSWQLILKFAATGGSTLSAAASADQPDSDGDSASHIDVLVEPENADLTGENANYRLVAGSQSSYRISHGLRNNGPTDAAEASVTGTISGGATIVPGSFLFIGDEELRNIADSQCTITPTTFFCAPLASSATATRPLLFPFLSYEVAVPDSPATITATATVSGRNDPDPSNNTSVVTLDVTEPAAELIGRITPVSGPVPAGQPVAVQGLVGSVGEIPAANVEVVIEAPADWTAALAPGAPTPGGTCSVESSGHAIRCAIGELAVSDTWTIDTLLTPPPGATGIGTVTLTASTDTPEGGSYPNVGSVEIVYTPDGSPTRIVTITPNTGLSDGDVVTLHGVGFTPSGVVGYCEGVITGGPHGPNDCGDLISTVHADTLGNFTTSVTIKRFLVVPEVGVVDCAQPEAPCGIGVADFFSPGQETLISPIRLVIRPPVEDPIDARIHGRVVDYAGNPLVGVNVSGYRSGDSWVGSVSTTTDANGSYVLEGAQPGFTYRIRFGPPAGSNLVAVWYTSEGGTLSRSYAADVTLTLTVPAVDMVLARSSTIMGTVRGSDGGPAAGVWVWGYSPGDGYVGTYLAISAADGSFRIEGVRPDQGFRILFAPPAGSGLKSEWFDDSPTRSAAATVSVSLGQASTFDAQLGPAAP